MEQGTVELKQAGGEHPNGEATPPVDMYEGSFVEILAREIGTLTCAKLLREQAIERLRLQLAQAITGVETSQATLRARNQDFETLRRLHTEVSTERDILKARVAELEHVEKPTRTRRSK